MMMMAVVEFEVLSLDCGRTGPAAVLRGLESPVGIGARDRVLDVDVDVDVREGVMDDELLSVSDGMSKLDVVGVVAMLVTTEDDEMVLDDRVDEVVGSMMVDEGIGGGPVSVRCLK